MVCERCNETVRPEDSFCPACGACIKVDRCRRGRGALIAMFVILVGYPLLRATYLIGVAIFNGEIVNAMLLVDPLLLLPLGFLFYRAFQGDRSARIPIVLFIIAIGIFRILAALVFSLLLNSISGLLGWVVTGVVEIGLGVFIYKSTAIEAYIASRKERKAFGGQEPK
jgi:hypothetical protein